MRYMDELLLIYDEDFIEKCMTAAGTWEQHLKHWGGEGAIESQAVGYFTDLQFVRWLEKCGYEPRPATLVESYITLDLDVK